VEYYGVDGGTINNEPFDLARTYLAGSMGVNPSSGTDAHRAVIMIDPFTDSRTEDPKMSKELLVVLQQLFTALKDQCRFKPFDLDLAENTNIYSRFLIAPIRGMYVGDQALCSSELGAFFGFFHENFRHHDFMLGRANCRGFLEDWFALPATNPLIRNSTKKTACPNRPNHFPIIPVRDNSVTPYPKWPRNAVRGYQDFAERIEARLDDVLDAVSRQASSAMNMNWLVSVITSAWILPIKPIIRKKLLKIIREQIDQAAEKINTKF
jgi:hypothetical protein